MRNPHVVSTTAARGFLAFSVGPYSPSSACKKARAYMKANDIPFQEKDIEADQNAARESKAKRDANGLGSGVPMIDVDGLYLIGFSPESLKPLLEKKGFI